MAVLIEERSIRDNHVSVSRMETIRLIESKGWQRPGCAGVCEQELPTCVRDVLESARASRPEHDVTCISFHAQENGRETARMGPEPELIVGGCTSTVAPRLHPKGLLVLTVTVTETTFERVQTVSHVLVARTHLHRHENPTNSV
jgi:hypothetical protein